MRRKRRKRSGLFVAFPKLPESYYVLNDNRSESKELFVSKEDVEVRLLADDMIVRRRRRYT